MMKKTVLYIALVGLSVFILTFLFPEQNIIDNIIEEQNLSEHSNLNNEVSQDVKVPEITSQPNSSDTSQDLETTADIPTVLTSDGKSEITNNYNDDDKSISLGDKVDNTSEISTNSSEVKEDKK